MYNQIKNNDDEQPESSNLSMQQKVLYQAFSDKDQKLASIYFGALSVLNHRENPDRLALAAHGLRELMEKMPLYLDAPILNRPPSLKEKTKELANHWHRCINKSDCRIENKWDGAIDTHLKKLLAKFEEFFIWLGNEHPARKERMAKVLRGLDPLGSYLPTSIEELRVREWEACNGFFQGVSHHNPNVSIEEEEFFKYLGVLEKFLLDRLVPRTFDDFANLDTIIREGELND